MFCIYGILMSHESCKNWKRTVYVHPVANHINHCMNTCRMTEVMYPWSVMVSDIRYSCIDYYLMKPTAYRTGTDSFSRTGNEQKCDVVLTFDDKGECTITQDASASGYTVTGKGKFVEDGEKDSWGDQDRNALYLEYTVKKSDGTTYVTTDTLIVRDRGVVLEEFSPVYKEV